MATSEEWLSRIMKLNMHIGKDGPAPHKPLLLLVVLELAEQGLLNTDRLCLTPELAFRFYSFWRIVAHRRRQRPDVRYPFHHLQREGVWSSLDEDGKPSPGRRRTRYAALAPDFMAAAQEAQFREKARRRIIARYFPPEERIALLTLVGLPALEDGQQASDTNDPSTEEARKKGRDARFRLNVVAAYKYACALTGYRLTTVSAGSIVEAAHIHQFASSRNDDPRNGLALCKNAHWLFDNGLWTISDDYKIVVAVGRFAEHSPDQKSLSEYHGQPILLPNDLKHWPDPIHLAWHRKHRFQGV